MTFVIPAPKMLPSSMVHMDLRLAGKRALITGAGSGIGRATARLLSQEGVAVGVVDVDDDAAEQVAFDISREGGQAVFFQADVADEDQVLRSVEAVTANFGGLEILVNNAGITGGPWGTLDQMDMARWDATMAVNLRAQVLYCRHAFPYLSRAGGAIVNNASSAAIVGWPQALDYATTKAGVVMLTRQLAGQWGKHGIRVNCVAPGMIDTGFGRGPASQPRPPRDPADQARRERYIPLGRTGQADDVASVIVFLASDMARYVSGECVIVDGGLLQMFYPAVLDWRP
jgi:NAD(P)-dependent dehydrogenase (short-subunit alcohol dehydrogenase family)